MAFTESGAIALPSKLRNPNNKYDEIQRRILIVKKEATKFGIIPPEEYRNDEHYWFTIMKRYFVVSNLLRDTIKNRDELKQVSLSIAANEAEEFLKLEKQKITDGLTGAWSRNALDNYLEELRKKPRKGFSTAVLLIDIDFFKKVNDDKGHLAGDNVLKALVEKIKENCRASDMVARYGGEEFVVTITGIQEEIGSAIARDKAEAIRTTIEKDKNLGVTISTGTTIIKNSDKNIIDIFQRADRNLYRAKKAGRNTTCSDEGLVIK